MKRHLWVYLFSWATVFTFGQVSSGAMFGRGGWCAPPPCQIPACQVVYEQREMTCYRTVYETAFREVRCVVNRPVYETHTQEVRETVCQPVTEFVEQECSIPVMKPVYETVQQERCRLVCRPVTTWCVQRVDCGHWEQQPADGSSGACCAPCRKVWVPNVVERKVPVTRMVAETERVTVPVTLCRYVSERQSRTVRVPVCKMVTRDVVRQVPITTCKFVQQEVVRQVPYTVCKQVPYTVKVCVPRCVPAANGPAPSTPTTSP